MASSLRPSRFFLRVHTVRSRTYKRDKDGRFGSGGGVRQSLQDASTLAEVSAVLAAEAKGLTGETLHVDMAGSDVQIAREHAEGVLRGFERYPLARVSQVITYGSGSGRPDTYPELQGETFAVAGIAPTAEGGVYFVRTVAFNGAYAGDGAKYRESLGYGEETGFVVRGGPMGTALHEFGHHIEGQLRAATASHRVATERAREAGERPSEHIRREISDYATTNNRELAAEAFADVMVNGSEASPTSHAIVAELDRRYQEAYPA